MTANGSGTASEASGPTGTSGTGPVGESTEHGWVWSALPARCESIVVRGDPDLEALLRSAGRTVAAEGSTSDEAPDAIVLAGPRIPGRAELRAYASSLRPGGLLIVAARARAPDVDRFGRVRFVTERLSLRRAPARRRVVRALKTAGLAVWRAEEHERSFGRRWVASGIGSIVIAGHEREPGMEDTVVEQVACALGRPLRSERRRVLSNGTLMIEVADDEGRRYVVRLAAGATAGLLTRTQQIRHALRDAGAGAAVLDRLAPTLAGGTTHGVTYTVEGHLPGSHPRRLDQQLLDACLDFLAALPVTARGHSADVAAVIEEDLAVLRPYLDGVRRASLDRVGAALEHRLRGLPAVWVHGDFWFGNLLVEAGRLRGVLDWDAGTRCGLPLSDALHLIALGDPSLRRLPHGQRCTERLWPLARAGGDARLRRCCERTGAPQDPFRLEALTVAYWLSRVARDVRTFGGPKDRPTWTAVNLFEPLTNLSSAGW